MDDVTKALERLEQRWREDAQKPGDGYDGAAYDSGVQETLLNCADELATLRQSLAGQGEVVAYCYVLAGMRETVTGEVNFLCNVDRHTPNDIPLYTAPRAAEAVTEKVKAEFPLLDDAGLDEAEHCCEWTLQQERKRLHKILADIARDYDDGEGDE